MSRIRSKDTKPELTLRRYLFRQGYRFRIHCNLKGKPDIVFPAKKIVIFVHGCFWHQHGCKNSVVPKSNRQFWDKKLKSNIHRDELVRKTLSNDGWNIKVIWECEIEKNVELAIESIFK